MKGTYKIIETWYFLDEIWDQNVYYRDELDETNLEQYVAFETFVHTSFEGPDGECLDDFTGKFIEGSFIGEDMGSIDDRISAWHESDSKKPLHVYLDLTEEQYEEWVDGSSKSKRI